MKKGILIISTGAFILLYLSNCNSNTSEHNISIPKDSATIAQGEASFNRYCSGCHNFRQDGIGPQLSGLTTEVPVDWIMHFIKNPKQVISSGDDRAQQLFKRFKAIMPSFDSLKDDKLNAVIAFINTHKFSPKKASEKYGQEITNPVPSPIQLSNLVVNLKFITQMPPSSDSTEPLPLTRITKLSFQPNTGNIFILDLQGKLYTLQNGSPTVYMDMAKLKPAFINKPGLATGFGSFAFHPDFAKNGLLYTTHTEAPGSAKADFDYADSIKTTVQWVLTEWKVNNPAASTFSGTGRELFRINMVTGIHGMQEITFNQLSKPGSEDYGLLYIGVGDGGSVENGYPFLAHSTEKIWGTVLRIDPTGRNSANGKYGIPTTNPFVQNGNNKTLKEIYAYGFRNPHRITWSKAGDMFVCNIGQANAESVNLIKPGHDYGWPIREGTYLLDGYGDLTRLYPLPANDSTYNITYPVAYFDHDEGLAITGGFEYSGKVIPQLAGKFLFGVIGTGRLFYINMADIKQGQQALIKEWRVSFNGKQGILKDFCEGCERVDLRLGRDADGEIYLLTKIDGKVYKLVGATIK